MLTSKKIWVIAYINREFIDIAKEEIKRYKHDDIEVYIPTVRVLKKKFKNKNQFEFVPLLFNYGFFKIPYNKVINPEYLTELRHQITCIYGWVKDPAKIQPDNSSGLNYSNSNFTDGLPSIAIATDDEVARLVSTSESMDIFDEKDLDRIKPGDVIKLNGYPFDDMLAEVIKINPKKREVKVSLHMDLVIKEITVSFENVYYSIYKNHDESLSSNSTDELASRYGVGFIDTLYKDEGEDGYY